MTKCVDPFVAMAKFMNETHVHNVRSGKHMPVKVIWSYRDILYVACTQGVLPLTENDTKSVISI